MLYWTIPSRSRRTNWVCSGHIFRWG